MKFRRKETVEATRWYDHGDHPAVERYYGNDQYPYVASALGVIKRHDGEFLVKPGDWIVSAVRGVYFPCNPVHFAMTYEPVEDA